MLYRPKYDETRLNGVVMRIDKKRKMDYKAEVN